jgi:CRISPR associated protein, Cas1 family
MGPSRCALRPFCLPLRLEAVRVRGRAGQRVKGGYEATEDEGRVCRDRRDLGILHTDKRYRESLAHHLMEPIRPVVAGVVIQLLRGGPLARGDVYETRGGCAELDRRWPGG